MSQIHEALSVLQQWGNVSKKELANGATLICHVPQVAPEAWFHIIYKGLTELELNNFQQKSPVQFPKDYTEFLKISNGLNAFSDSLSVWGLRRSFVRTGEEAIQPYDLNTLNQERPQGCPQTWLFFGSYSWDGKRVMFDTTENITGKNRVYRCTRKSKNIIQEWPSFENWLFNEVKRISKLFDHLGIKHDKNVPTAPLLGD